MIRILVSVLTILLLSSLAHADIEWSGVYRFEGVLINDASLDEKGGTKEYGIHHLVLKPKIIIADAFRKQAVPADLRSMIEPLLPPDTDATG